MRRYLTLVGVLLAILAVAACAAAAPQVPTVEPTKTPKPTFTPTANVPPPTVAFATATKAPAPAATAAPAAAATAAPQPSPTVAPPTPTVAPAKPKLTANQTVNVRNGPGTNYTRTGELSAGQAFEIVGKNPAGDWFQFMFDGKPGWVRNDFVTISGDTGPVQVAQNIPAPPPTAPPPPPPPPTAPPQPTAPPAPPAPTFPWSYVANSAVAAPQCGVANFSGKVTYRDGSPQNGVCVVIDYYGPRQLKYTGSGGQGDGNWGFSPCGQGDCKGTTSIYIVECPPNVPDGGIALDGAGIALRQVSDKFQATITDKCTTGQWTSIIFKGPQ